MITAGSVRGNCWLAALRRTPARGRPPAASSAAAAARAEPVRARATRPAPIACTMSARRPARRPACGSTPRSADPVGPRPVRLGLDDHARSARRRRRSPRKHPQARRGSVGRRVPADRPPASSTGRTGCPRPTSTRVAGSAQLLVEPGLVGAPLADPVVACARTARCRSSRVRGSAGRSRRCRRPSAAAHEHPHRRRARRDRARSSCCPATRCGRGGSPRRSSTTRSCYTEVRGMSASPAPGSGQPVSVQGSGMGQPSMAIYVNELFREYDVAVDRPGRLLRRADRGPGAARRGDRLRAPAPTPR